MKRWFFPVYIGVLTLTLLVFLVNIGFRIPIFNQWVITIIQDRVQNQTGYRVTIDHMDGNVFMGITCRDIMIYGAQVDGNQPTARVDRLVVTFKPSVWVTNGLSFIRSITIDGGYIPIIRGKNQQIYLIDSGHNQSPKIDLERWLSLVVSIQIQNVSGVVHDHRGWGKEPSTFVVPFEQLTGRVNVDRWDKTSVFLTALLPETYGRKVTMNGHKTPMGFSVNVDAKELVTNKWAPYVVPVKGLTIQNDRFDALGTLAFNTKSGEGEFLPFMFNISIGFDYLMVNVSGFSHPFTNSSGSMTFSNASGQRVVTFDHVLTNYQSIPMSVVGGVNIDDRTLNVTLTSQTKEPIGQVLPDTWRESLTGEVSTIMQFNGPFNAIQSHIILDLDTLKWHDWELGDLDLLLKKQGQKWRLSTQSSQKDRRLSGDIIFGKSFDIKGDDFLLNLPNLPKPMPFSMAISGTPKAVHVKLTPTEPAVLLGLGIGVESISGDIMVQPQSVIFPKITMMLSNGASVQWAAVYERLKSHVSVHQTGFNPGLNRNNQPIISHMDSYGSFKKIGDKWVPQYTIDVSGERLEYREMMIDSFDVSYGRDHSRHDLLIHSLLVGGGRMSGDMIFTKSSLNELTMDVYNMDLQFFNGIDKRVGYANVSGRLNGHFRMRNMGREWALNATVQNAQSVLGHFGDMSIEASQKNNQMAIKKIRFMNGHDLTIDGHIDMSEDPELWLNAEGDIRLGMLDAFSKVGIRGHAGIKGVFKGPISALGYKGMFQSDGMYFKESKLSDLYVDGEFSASHFHIRQSSIRLGDGQVMLNGNMSLSPNQSFRFHAIDTYDMSITLDHVNLSDVFTIYSLAKTSFQPSLPMNRVDLNRDFEFHQGQPNNLSEFKKLMMLKDITLDYGGYISGDLNGYLKVSNTFVKNNVVQLQLKDLNVNHQVAIQNITVQSTYINKKREQYDVQMQQLKINDHVMERVDLTLDILSNLQNFHLIQSRIKYNNQWIQDPIQLEYDRSSQYVSGNLSIDQDGIDLVSVVSPAIQSIQNRGRISTDFYGHLSKIQFKNTVVDLTNFELVMASNGSSNSSVWQVNSFNSVGKEGGIFFDGVTLKWAGDHTYRRVTRDIKNNTFDITGRLVIESLDLLKHPSLSLWMDLGVPYAFLSVHIPQKFSGDLVVNQARLTGGWDVPLVAASQPSNAMRIPTLSGTVQFQDSIFDLPNGQSGYEWLDLGFDMTLTLGKGNYIQGGLFRGGIYDLASHVSLEIDEKMADRPFALNGTLRSPKLTTDILFYGGSLSILDGVYDLLTPDEQAHYFSQMPQKISQQYVRIYPIQRDGVDVLAREIHLRALRKKDRFLSAEATQNLSLDPYPYSAVGLVVDGDLNQAIPMMTVLDYGLDNMYSARPRFELKGEYMVDVGGIQSPSELTLHGVNLLIPDVISNADESTFVLAGRQRINAYIRRSIRPYERRLAQRVGLYDFRIMYDFGKTLLTSQSDPFQSNDLLGIQVISDVSAQRLFLTLRGDVNLSSDYQSENEQGFKLTQVDLKYLVSPYLSVGLKNVNEYSDVVTFDPRWWLNYGFSY